MNITVFQEKDSYVSPGQFFVDDVNSPKNVYQLVNISDLEIKWAIIRVETGAIFCLIDVGVSQTTLELRRINEQLAFNLVPVNIADIKFDLA